MTARARAETASVLLLLLLAGLGARAEARSLAPPPLGNAGPERLTRDAPAQPDTESRRLTLQPDPVTRSARLQPDAPSQPSSAEWDFDEEELVPTWGASVRAQAVDLAMFAGFAGLALVGFFRKSVWLKYVTLAVSVVYLGVYKSQLISIVNVFGLVSWNLPLVRYNLGWYVFAGVQGRAVARNIFLDGSTFPSTPRASTSARSSATSRPRR